MNNYAKGARFERIFIEQQESQDDCIYAIRSAGSKGIIDAIVLRSEGHPQRVSVWAYQLKYGKKKPALADASLDYMQFLQDFGIHCRIVWKKPNQPVQTFTVEEARKLLLVAPKKPKRKKPSK
jgi:hypothetical protein